MSLLRNRAKSAGMVHKAGLTGNVLMLQDTVVQLQQQLLQSRMENKRVKDQLNCLITLVKQAWSGDRSAVLHVAKIVGVAVPDIVQEVKQDQIILAAKPKSRAVNNWARLTIGLLNQVYNQLEEELEEKQREYFRSRQAFLEEQVEPGYAKPPSYNNTQGRQQNIIQPPPTPVQNGYSHHIIQPSPQPEQKPNTSQKKPTVRHLYRPASQKAERGHEPLTWGDIAPDQNQDCLLNKLNNKQMNVDYCDRQAVSYIDPYRYNKDGLFNEDATLASDNMKPLQRPMSCKSQRQNNNLRQRPKSAVLPKGQRPLKYETTRPVSQKACKNKQETGQKRPQSCKTTTWRTFITNQQSEESESQPGNTERNTQLPSRYVDLHSDSDEIDSETEAREQRKREAEALLVKIKLPESVQKFHEELANMEKMEQDFKIQTLSLQKKLGINPDGLIL